MKKIILFILHLFFLVSSLDGYAKQTRSNIQSTQKTDCDHDNNTSTPNISCYYKYDCFTGLPDGYYSNRDAITHDYTCADGIKCSNASVVANACVRPVITDGDCESMPGGGGTDSNVSYGQDETIIYNSDDTIFLRDIQICSLYKEFNSQSDQFNQIEATLEGSALSEFQTAKNGFVQAVLDYNNASNGRDNAASNTVKEYYQDMIDILMDYVVGDGLNITVYDSNITRFDDQKDKRQEMLQALTALGYRYIPKIYKNINSEEGMPTKIPTFYDMGDYEQSSTVVKFPGTEVDYSNSSKGTGFHKFYGPITVTYDPNSSDKYVANFYHLDEHAALCVNGKLVYWAGGTGVVTNDVSCGATSPSTSGMNTIDMYGYDENYDFTSLLNEGENTVYAWLYNGHDQGDGGADIEVTSCPSNYSMSGTTCTKTGHSIVSTIIDFGTSIDNTYLFKSINNEGPFSDNEIKESLYEYIRDNWYFIVKDQDEPKVGYGLKANHGAIDGATMNTSGLPFTYLGLISSNTTTLQTLFDAGLRDSDDTCGGSLCTISFSYFGMGSESGGLSSISPSPSVGTPTGGLCNGCMKYAEYVKISGSPTTKLSWGLDDYGFIYSPSPTVEIPSMFTEAYITKQTFTGGDKTPTDFLEMVTENIYSLIKNKDRASMEDLYAEDLSTDQLNWIANYLDNTSGNAVAAAKTVLQVVKNKTSGLSADPDTYTSEAITAIKKLFIALPVSFERIAEIMKNVYFTEDEINEFKMYSGGISPYELPSDYTIRAHAKNLDVGVKLKAREETIVFGGNTFTPTNDCSGSEYKLFHPSSSDDFMCITVDIGADLLNSTWTIPFDAGSSNKILYSFTMDGNEATLHIKGSVNVSKKIVGFPDTVTAEYIASLINGDSEIKNALPCNNFDTTLSYSVYYDTNMTLNDGYITCKDAEDSIEYTMMDLADPVSTTLSESGQSITDRTVVGTFSSSIDNPLIEKCTDAMQGIDGETLYLVNKEKKDSISNQYYMAEVNESLKSSINSEITIYYPYTNTIGYIKDTYLAAELEKAQEYFDQNISQNVVEDDRETAKELLLNTISANYPYVRKDLYVSYPTAYFQSADINLLESTTLVQKDATNTIFRRAYEEDGENYKQYLKYVDNYTFSFVIEGGMFKFTPRESFTSTKEPLEAIMTYMGKDTSVCDESVITLQISGAQYRLTGVGSPPSAIPVECQIPELDYFTKEGNQYRIYKTDDSISSTLAYDESFTLVSQLKESETLLDALNCTPFKIEAVMTGESEGEVTCNRDLDLLIGFTSITINDGEDHTYSFSEPVNLDYILNSASVSSSDSAKVEAIKTHIQERNNADYLTFTPVTFDVEGTTAQNAATVDVLVLNSNDEIETTIRDSMYAAKEECIRHHRIDIDLDIEIRKVFEKYKEFVQYISENRESIIRKLGAGFNDSDGPIQALNYSVTQGHAYEYTRTLSICCCGLTCCSFCYKPEKDCGDVRNHYKATGNDHRVNAIKAFFNETAQADKKAYFKEFLEEGIHLSTGDSNMSIDVGDIATFDGIQESDNTTSMYVGCQQEDVFLALPPEKKVYVKQESAMTVLSKILIPVFRQYADFLNKTVGILDNDSLNTCLNDLMNNGQYTIAKRYFNFYPSFNTKEAVSDMMSIKKYNGDEGLTDKITINSATQEDDGDSRTHQVTISGTLSDEDAAKEFCTNILPPKYYQLNSKMNEINAVAFLEGLQESGNLIYKRGYAERYFTDARYSPNPYQAKVCQDSYQILKIKNSISSCTDQGGFINDMDKCQVGTNVVPFDLKGAAPDCSLVDWVLTFLGFKDCQSELQEYYQDIIYSEKIVCNYSETNPGYGDSFQLSGDGNDFYETEVIVQETHVDRTNVNLLFVDEGSDQFMLELFDLVGIITDKDTGIDRALSNIGENGLETPDYVFDDETELEKLINDCYDFKSEYSLEVIDKNSSEYNYLSDNNIKKNYYNKDKDFVYEITDSTTGEKVQKVAKECSDIMNNETTDLFVQNMDLKDAAKMKYYLNKLVTDQGTTQVDMFEDMTTLESIDEETVSVARNVLNEATQDVGYDMYVDDDGIVQREYTAEKSSNVQSLSSDNEIGGLFSEADKQTALNTGNDIQGSAGAENIATAVDTAISFVPYGSIAMTAGRIAYAFSQWDTDNDSAAYNTIVNNSTVMKNSQIAEDIHNNWAADAETLEGLKDELQKCEEMDDGPAKDQCYENLAKVSDLMTKLSTLETQISEGLEKAEDSIDEAANKESLTAAVNEAVSVMEQDDETAKNYIYEHMDESAYEEYTNDVNGSLNGVEACNTLYAGNVTARILCKRNAVSSMDTSSEQDQLVDNEGTTISGVNDVSTNTKIDSMVTKLDENNEIMLEDLNVSTEGFDEEELEKYQQHITDDIQLQQNGL